MSTQELLQLLSPTARERIRAGIFDIEALWHERDTTELPLAVDKRFLGLCYEVFAKEITPEMECTDELLGDTLVKLAYDVMIEHGWARWPRFAPQGTAQTKRPNRGPAVGSLDWAKELVHSHVARWHATIIRRQLPKTRPSPAELLEGYRVKNFPHLSHEGMAEQMGLERTRYFRMKAGKRVREDAYHLVSQYTGIPISDLKP